MIRNAVTINGLTINDYVAARTAGYEGFITIEDVEGLDEAEFEYEIQNLAFQDGSIMSEGYYNGRLITIEAMIYGVDRASRNNAMHALKNALNPKLNFGQTINITYIEEGDPTPKVLYCRPTGRFKPDRKRSEFGKKRVIFSVFCPDPRIYDNVVKTRTLTLNKNLLLWSEDISQSAWVVEGTATKTDSDTVSSIAVNGGIRQTVATGNHANKTYTFQVELSGTVGQTVSIYIADGVGGAIGTPVQVTLTGTFTQYAVTRTFTGAETSTNTVVYIVRRTGDTATSFNVRKAQLIEYSQADEYRKNENTYGGTNGVILATYLPLFLVSGIGDKFKITNDGTYNAIPKIRIGGAVVNPALVNDTTGEYIQFNYSLAEGQYLDIDIKNRIITREDGSNVYGFITEDSRFWDLIAGDNIIGFTADDYSASAYAVIEYQNAYI